MPNCSQETLSKSQCPHSQKVPIAHDLIIMEEIPITISSTQTTILAAISTLPPPHLSHLTHSIAALFYHHRGRLFALLSSPILFSLTLHHLHSLSLPKKSLLIARHLLSTISLLTHFLHPTTATSTPLATTAANLRRLDSALLLLLLCEFRQHDPQSLETPLSKWRLILSNYISNTILTISTIPTSDNSVLIQYIETIAKCRRFVGVMGCGGGGKEGKDVAASVAAVVALPSVEVSGETECAICKEEMKEGRDVCELPCDHLFHWICILPWLTKRNTCPCCRLRLPTDDAYGEIERLWEVVVKAGGTSNLGV